MTVKDRVLDRLGREKDSISGEKLAAELGVSRTAVWKAIGELRDEGYLIEAAQKRGYRLAASPDFSAASLARELAAERLTADLPDPGRFAALQTLVLGETDSTNKVARELAARNAPETLILAAKQTAGRGRLGRSFYSPGGSGLYMSMLLYPGCAAADASVMTTAAAVAVCRALERLDPELKPMIKWVNDVYIGNRKVCGILTEGQVDFETGTLAFAVPGIGVNIYSPDGGWTADLENRAGAVFSKPCGELRTRLAAMIAAEFFRYYPRLRISDFIGEYRRRMFLTGMEVTVVPIGGENYQAIVKGVDDELRLIVADGRELKYLASGEVSLKL